MQTIEDTEDTIVEKKLQSILWKAGGYMTLKKSDLAIILHHQGKKLERNDESPVKLGYFPFRALGFLPQLMLEDGGISYECHLFAGKSFFNLKSNLPFGRMPVLLDWYGKGNHLTQSSAIIRVLATATNLAGVDDREQSRCDMLYEQLKEAFGGGQYSTSALKKGPIEGKDEDIPRWEELSRVNECSLFQRSVAALRCFEALLVKNKMANNKNTFLVGAQLTYIDLALWSKLLELSQPDNVPQWADRFLLPNLKELYSTITERPNINAFLQSGRLLPRIGEGYTFKEGIYCKPIPTNP